MSKTSYAAMSLVAAIPALFLCYLLTMAFLSNADKMPGALTAVAGLTLILSSLVAVTPIGIFIGGGKGLPKPAKRSKKAAAAKLDDPESAGNVAIDDDMASAEEIDSEWSESDELDADVSDEWDATDDASSEFMESEDFEAVGTSEFEPSDDAVETVEFASDESEAGLSDEFEFDDNLSDEFDVDFDFDEDDDLK